MVSDPAPGGARAVARCTALAVAPYSDMDGRLYRGWLTPAWRAATERLAEWMAEAGMTVSTDAATNIIGRYEGTQDGPALIIGSHIDSVRDGGCYDGPLGVLLGIETVAALHAGGRRPPFPIEVIAFGDEEGSRFPAAMLTSRAVAGTLDPVPDMADAAGVTLADALEAVGATPDGMAEARHAPALAYLETHIEQGPALEAQGLPVGIVTGIAAQLRYVVTLTGTAGHAGTTTMPLRRDALAGAAEMMLAAERIARDDASDLVATVGRIEVAPGAPNVIPGRAVFTLDIRAGSDARRDAAAASILAGLRAIADRRGLAIAIEQTNDLAASPCDPALTDLLEAAVAEQGIAPFRLVSGAGHDAMVMAALCPTAMLFVRCKGGISHNPAEHVEAADSDAALAVMLGFIERLEGRVS
ncbi:MULTISPECIES: allantoate amidohydrolase [Sphingomonadales]|uniref:N-carbamoyl-L-amino acid hydrolase n=1 Tax=Edaphosphingomonas haloaromaticamans TaxID=653954 RepID=A0A1S1HBJ8_9SPHN|nr:allantoate amidohydrolase [Sphingomonas haloaromaticamans]OHT18683.1 N-carbamoyl-L-amino acid hydrolase [Sphingomonas haloaromaticamans]